MSDGAFAVLGYNWANEKFASAMAARQQQARVDQIRVITQDLQNQAQSNPKNAARRVGDLLGNATDADVARYASQLGGGSRDALIRRAAEAQNPGLLQRAYGAAAQDGWQGQAVRGGIVTAGIGGGVMGGVALTEAGQQLLALMDYMQQGQATEAKREEAPIA